MSTTVLQDDMGEALLATFNATTARWSMLDTSGTSLRVEYARVPQLWQDGALSRCIIRPLVVGPVAREQSEGAALSRFPFVLEFTLNDKVNKNAMQDMMHAVLSTFGDRGAQAAANLNDTGSNLIGSPGELTIEGTEEVESGFGLDYVRADVLLVWTARHKIPMT